MKPADDAESTDGSTDGNGGTLLCPSAGCEPGAVLVGMVGGDGRVGYVLPQLPVSERFVEFARTGGAPERRFRFALPCIQRACTHWTGSRCRLIDEVVETVDPRAVTPVVAPRRPAQCGIRSDCRWFLQSGLDACTVCPLVVTDRRSRG
jgi:hypothetical protein